MAAYNQVDASYAAPMGESAQTMKNTRATALNVLVLGDLEQGDDVSSLIGAHAHLHRAATLAEANSLCQDHSFDLVVVPADRFSAVADFARDASVVAPAIGSPVGLVIVDADGTATVENPTQASFPPEIRQSVLACCREALSLDGDKPPDSGAPPRVQSHQFVAADNSRFEVCMIRLSTTEGLALHAAAFVVNTTRPGGLQGKIDAIDRAGQELLNLDVDQVSSLDVQERLALLEQKIIRCTEELLHFDNFEIRVIDRSSDRLEQVLAYHVPLHVQNIDLYARSEGNGICGYVAARGQSYICPDTSKDTRYITGISGSRSSLTVPLRLNDEVVGIANFESNTTAAFGEDDRQYAEILARYVALALHVLELLISERRTTTGQLGSNVMAEITGPLNDILTEAESLVEDYIGHDDLRHRLRGLSENAVKIRETVKELTSRKPGLIGARTTRKMLADEVLGGKRVLLADDEETIRDTVRDVLTGYGCEVSAVNNGEAAIALIAQQPFDLVLSDIKMPGKDGYQVFAAAKDANPQTPVILTTGFGYDPNHSIVRARREGLAAVLFKPFKVDQLLDELRAALRNAEQSAHP